MSQKLADISNQLPAPFPGNAWAVRAKRPTGDGLAGATISAKESKRTTGWPFFSVVEKSGVEIGLLDAQLRGLRQLVSEATTGADYNEAVAKYNAQVIVYNEAAKSLRAKVATFNGQVNAYNNCLNR